MDKPHKVVGPEQLQSSQLQYLTTDWSKCALCQEDTSQALRCPADSKRDSQGAGYMTVAGLLEGFDKIGCLSRKMNLARFDEGDGIEATLCRQKAKWHDSCRLKYNKTQLLRADSRKRAANQAEDQAETSKQFTRFSSGEASSTTESTCFFCAKPGTAGKSLCKASTFGMDVRVRQCAVKLQDKELLAKLSAGDLIAQDAKYHLPCLVSLYNRARETTTSEDSNADALNHGIAFAELVSYIEDCRKDTELAPIFKLTDLTNLYNTRLMQLGTDTEGRVHSTRLKERIFCYFPDMEAHRQGRNLVLMGNEHIGSALKKACEYDADNEAVILARAAKIVRRDMLQLKNKFDGSFDSKCQEESVPSSLMTLVSMVLNGPNIIEQSRLSAIPQSVLTISQLLMYNSSIRRRGNSVSTPKHSRERETPLPIFLGALIHSKTRKRELVDYMFELGLSISYDHVLDISTMLGNRICKLYNSQGVVCPPQLRRGVFTTAAVDNIDHNPSSTSARGSLHGTGISIFEHPDSDCSGLLQPALTPISDADGHNKKLMCLPEAYTNVPPATLVKHDPPPKERPSNGDFQLISRALSKEHE